MDPQHRVFLECAWSALEDAGYDPATFPGLIGLFGGVAPNTYRHQVLADPPRHPRLDRPLPVAHRQRARVRASLAPRSSSALEGPVINVNTACSTSGVALHLACQSVLSGECDMALAGGVACPSRYRAGYVVRRGRHPLARRSLPRLRRRRQGHGRGQWRGDRRGEAAVGRARATATPFAPSSRERAINNDGADKIGFTAPSMRGQEAVIRQALDMAEVDASTIGYVEAHGTGTFIGDPIEVEALTPAFRRRHRRRGLLRDRLDQDQHRPSRRRRRDRRASSRRSWRSSTARSLPASTFRRRTPRSTSPRARSWSSDRAVRVARRALAARAGVSSFGLGGTNAHVVLEQAPAPAPPAPSTRDHQLFVLSARNGRSGARGRRAQSAAHLERHPELEPADVAHTLAVGRRHHGRRRAVVARDAAEAARALHAASACARCARSRRRPPGRLHVPGRRRPARRAWRGALHATEPEFRRWFDRCAELTEPRDRRRPAQAGIRAANAGRTSSGRSMRCPRCSPRSTPLACIAPVARRSAGIDDRSQPGRVHGGVPGRRDEPRGRGRTRRACAAELFESLPPGAMLAVPAAGRARSRAAAGRRPVDRGINKPDLCIVAGAGEPSTTSSGGSLSEGIDAVAFGIAVAAHSHLVEPILERFGDFASTIEFSEPSIPFISNLTGSWSTPRRVCQPGLLGRAPTQHRPLRRRPGGGAGGASRRSWSRSGPGQILSGFARQHPGVSTARSWFRRSRTRPRSMPDDAFFLEAVGQALGGRRAGRPRCPALRASNAVGCRSRRIRSSAHRHWIERGDCALSIGPRCRRAADSDEASRAARAGAGCAAGAA